MGTNRSGLRIIVLAVVAQLTLSGCSLFVPYVKPSVERYARDSQGNAITPISLAHATEYANSLKDGYESALRTQAALTSSLGVALIPLSAATLGLGIVGGGRNAMTALGLTAAAGYGVGTWLQSRPRQHVYILGVAALDCLIDAFAPLGSVPAAAQGELTTALYDGKAGLMVLIPAFEEELRKAQGQIAALPPGNELRKTLESEVADAVAVLAAAKTAWTNGTALETKIRTAGADLTQAVDGVRRKVNDAILATEPDVKGLAALVGGVIPSSARGVALLPPVAAPKDEQLERRGSEPLTRLTSSTALATRRVAQILDTVKLPNLTACVALADAAAGATALSLTPDGTLDITAPGSGRIRVVGGAPPYAATFLVTPEAPGQLRPEIAIEGAVAYVVVHASEDVKSGTYPVFVADKTGTGRSVRVVVTPSPTPRPAKPSGLMLEPAIVKLAKGANRLIAIKGGAAPYTTRTEGELKGITTRVVTGADDAPALLLEVGKDASGKGQVRVRDKDGTEKGVVIEITP